MGFFRQEYWSGLPCPPPGDLPDPGIEPVSLLFPALKGSALPRAPPGKPTCTCHRWWLSWSPAMRETWLQPLLGRSPGEGKGYPLQYSGLENPMDCIVHEVIKSQTRLSGFHCKCYHLSQVEVFLAAQMVKNLPAIWET